MHPPDGLHPWYVELLELFVWVLGLTAGKIALAGGSAFLLWDGLRRWIRGA